MPQFSVQDIIPNGRAYLAGQWVQLSTTLPVINPWSGETIAHVSSACAADFESAIAQAENSFAITRRLSSYQRAEACLKVSQLLNEHFERFARLMTAELGKSVRESRLEVARAVGVFATAAEEAKRIGGEIIDLDWTAGNEERFGLVRRFPIGVISGITPFNFPLNLVAHKIAPAMATGNCIVVKPASKTPLSALALAELIDQTDYPKGAISILPALASESFSLITNSKVKLVSFTGSDVVGWELQKQATGKKVALELGGNAGVIVAADANLERASSRIVSGAFGVAGQSCISVQRIYLHKDIAEGMTALLREKASALVVGDPTNERTDVGIMVDAAAVARTSEWIADAIARGARVIIGNESRTAHPLLFSPTLLADVPPEHPLCSHEVFAPVAVIETYTELSDVIMRLNKSPFGLQAGIFTSQLGDALTAWREIECGGIIVNDIPTWRVDQMPYGGMKRSGTGREGIRYAMEEMTEPKLLAIRPE